MEEKEGGLLSGSAEAKRLSINLLFMTRAAASVGYTELPLAFQKNRLSWVPSVLCLSSKQPCLPSHTAQTKNQWPYKPQSPLKWWDVPKRLSSAVPGKQRESWMLLVLHPATWVTTPDTSAQNLDLCSLPQYSQINSHMQIRFSPVSMTTHCTELLPRSAQWLLFNFISYKLCKNIREKSGYALVIM